MVINFCAGLCEITLLWQLANEAKHVNLRQQHDKRRRVIELADRDDSNTSQVNTMLQQELLTCTEASSECVMAVGTLLS